MSWLQAFLEALSNVSVQGILKNSSKLLKITENPRKISVKKLLYLLYEYF